MRAIFKLQKLPKWIIADKAYNSINIIAKFHENVREKIVNLKLRHFETTQPILPIN